jgi:hypothetical protein
MIPFAVVGSERTVLVDGKPVRGRKNRWGVVNVENEAHCEFVHLRNFLTRYIPSPLPRPVILANAGARQLAPAGPDRDDGADPLRGLPLQAAPRAQGRRRAAPVRRQLSAERVAPLSGKRCIPCGRNVILCVSRTSWKVRGPRAWRRHNSRPARAHGSLHHLSLLEIGLLL